ncbi:uncharacterized protein MELLADRAFT_109010 [Melampsora larici-populina 98AG31]|uniref:Uncharacterized protein n=1 Tax=Melampsora larici-populina (strain 98AG31 / pathotype 3-4-7) TaxID=747676 RepID=F4RV13_MELLP|nr:uncharacterized protein MELLADRAFT_109010 [Melampsora larici-populina 98AG31]EGG03795.1 hypothetical protein MELLADRAFT_109010 [Melampsora larici-populina 98AG31]
MPHNHASNLSIRSPIKTNRPRSSSLPKSYVMPAGQTSSENDPVYARLKRGIIPAKTRPQSPYRTEMPEGYVPLAAMPKNRQSPLYPISQDIMDEEYVPLAAMSRNNRLASIRKGKQTSFRQNNASSIYNEDSIPNPTLPDQLSDLPSPPSTGSSHSSDHLSGMINDFPSVPAPQPVPSPTNSSTSRTSRISRRESILRQFPTVPAPPQVALPQLPGKRRYSSLGNIGQVSELHQALNPENIMNTGYAHQPKEFVKIEDYYVELFSEIPKVKRNSSFSLVRKLSGSFRKMFKHGKDGKY